MVANKPPIQCYNGVVKVGDVSLNSVHNNSCNDFGPTNNYKLSGKEIKNNDAERFRGFWSFSIGSQE